MLLFIYVPLTICNFIGSQSEKIIVPTESSRPLETPVIPKDSAYKKFARNLCGGGNRRRPITVGKKTPANVAAITAIDTSTSPKANGRWSKHWPAVWKRRPRLCCQCGVKKPKVPAKVERPTTTIAKDVRRRQRWRQWLSCNNCSCKRKKKLTVSRMSSSSISVGALGIAPPTITNTFCNKLKQRLSCNCFGRCAVPNFVRKLCFCYYRRGGNSEKTNAPKKKSAIRRRSLFKCTGCCTVSFLCIFHFIPPWFCYT